MAALTGCSIDEKGFPPPVKEDCASPGDEDGNGLADCEDPVCVSEPSCGPRCGNGKVEASEVCDDGTAASWDGCESNCTPSVLAYVKASNTGMGDRFGHSIAMSADGLTLAVGAPFEDGSAKGVNGGSNELATDAGAVYVFTRSGTTWIQQAYIKATNSETGDRFGSSVALSANGATLAVGAPLEDGGSNAVVDSGAVYVFIRVGSQWSAQAYLRAPNAEVSDRFGSSVALSGDGSTMAVGAPFEDGASNATVDSGAVYVSTRSGTSWGQPVPVRAAVVGKADHFGSSVALTDDGATLAVGADEEDSKANGVNGDPNDNTALEAGAVYVFTSTATGWSQQSYIKASNTNPDDHFGTSVALSGNGSTLAVGAIGEDSAAKGIGGDEGDNTAVSAGAVYMFTRNLATWSQQAYIKASNAGAGDLFGQSVALSANGSILAVGGPGEDSAARTIGGNQDENTTADAGAVYMFMRNGTLWSQQAYTKASNTDPSDNFGQSVALSADGSLLAAGAWTEAGPATGVNGDQTLNTAPSAGAVYIYY